MAKTCHSQLVLVDKETERIACDKSEQPPPPRFFPEGEGLAVHRLPKGNTARDSLRAPSSRTVFRAQSVLDRDDTCINIGPSRK